MRVVDIDDPSVELEPGERGELMFRGPMAGFTRATSPRWMRTATARELIAHCREHLAANKIPRAVQFVDDVPITASGKIMRRLLTDVDDGTR